MPPKKLELDIYTIKNNHLPDDTIKIMANIKTIRALLGKTLYIPKKFDDD